MSRRSTFTVSSTVEHGGGASQRRTIDYGVRETDIIIKLTNSRLIRTKRAESTSQ